MDDDYQRAERSRKLAPIVVATAAPATFVVIMLAGHSMGKAFLVAGIMVAFMLFMIKTIEWFGAQIASAIFATLAGIIGLSQWLGWI